MDTLRGNLGIWVASPAGIGYEVRRDSIRTLNVGEAIRPGVVTDLGFREGRLSERHVAFLLLLLLERNGDVRSPIVKATASSQRRRFAERFGVRDGAFRRWLARAVADQPGRILRWDRRAPGPEPSRTGGPWWLGTRNAILLDTTVRDALDFIERQYRKGIGRRGSPVDLLADALAAREEGYWLDAFALLEECKSMLRRRRWRRDDPLYFEVLLVLAGTEMQMGAEALRPKLSANILRSVSRQRLGGPKADLVKAQAYYIAALIYNQMNDPKAIRKVLDNLERARDLLKGRTDLVAVREYWRYSSYLELTNARLTGFVRPESTSAILQAGRVIEDSYDQKQMRYGEALLHAGRPGKAIEYIQRAIESGRLSTPAVVIAERLAAIARWKVGESPGVTYDALVRVEHNAESLSFAHQLRLIREAKRRVRRASQSSTKRRPDPD